MLQDEHFSDPFGECDPCVVPLKRRKLEPPPRKLKFFTRCDYCGKWLFFSRPRHNGAAYADDSENWDRAHNKCMAQAIEMYEEHWHEYYSGCL